MGSRLWQRKVESVAEGASNKVHWYASELINALMHRFPPAQIFTDGAVCPGAAGYEGHPVPGPEVYLHA